MVASGLDKFTKIKRLSTVFLGLTMLFSTFGNLSVSAALEVSASTTSNTITTDIRASEDAYISQAEPTIAKGVSDPANNLVTMNAGADTAASRRDGLLKFDISGLPAGTISSAKLIMYAKKTTNSGNRTTSVYAMNSDNWSESTVTWNNAPTYSSTTPLATWTTGSSTADGTKVEFDLSSYFTQNPSKKVFSLRLVLDTAVVYYYTKENAAYAPKLQVEYTNGVTNQVLFDQGAWCWFADPRALKHTNPTLGINKTYVGVIDINGTIKAIQQDNITNERKEVVIRTGFQQDDHDNPTFLTLPDGRVMVFYSEHTSEPVLYYKVTDTSGDLSTLGPEKTISTSGYGNFTYPSPFILRDQSGSFYIFWRGVNWHPTVAKFTLPDANGNITMTTTPKQIVDSRKSSTETGKRPYAKYFSDGKNKVYITYTYTHPDNIVPNSLYSSYLDVNTMDLYDITGTKLTNVNTAPYKVTNAEPATNPVLVDRTTGIRNWNWQIALDKTGKPVILMVKINSAKDSHQYYYVKWTGTQWKETLIGDGGKWFHQGTSEHSYSGGMTLNENNVNEVYMSIPVTGQYGSVYEIYKVMLDDDANIVYKTAITSNSPKNNVRPYIIKGASQTDAIYLAWMYGDYTYWSGTSYNTSLKSAIFPN